MSHSDEQHRGTDALLSEERERLADVLHETLAQDLSLISMTARRAMSPEDVGTVLTEIADTADRMAGSLRTILLDLKHPAEESLREVVARAAGGAARHRDVRLLIDVAPDISASLPQKVAISRVVREAVGNALRHGGARSLVVRADQDAVHLRVEITDDGSGFDPAVVRRLDAFGIDGMHRTIAGVGGTLHISSRQGEGTSVQIELP